MSVLSAGVVKYTICTIFNYVVGSCRIALIMGAGDLLMQHYSGGMEIKQINWQRTAKYATVGLCFVGPILTYWKSIVKLIFNTSQSHTARVLKQLFCDQLYLAPCINLGIMTISGIVNNETIEEVEKQVAKYYPTVMKHQYMLWPGVQLFCSVCIKPSLQIIFSNIITIFFGMLTYQEFYIMMTCQQKLIRI